MDQDDKLDVIIHGADSAGLMQDEGSVSEIDPKDISDPASAERGLVIH